MGAIVGSAVGAGTPLGGLLGGAAGSTLPATDFGNFNLGQTLGVQNGYNATMAPGTTEQLSAGQNAFNSNLAGQQALLAALQAQSQGQGPNPAQAMLNQATNQNIAQNAGMIASQKGINPALATRQASINAANAGQQAAGQGATMAAQQQLGAQNAMAGVYGQIGNQALDQQKVAQEGFYAPQNINAGVAAGNAKTNAGLIGSLAGGAAKFAAMAHGGTVPGYADGGLIGGSNALSNAAKFFQGQLNEEVAQPEFDFGKAKPEAASPTLGYGGPMGQSAMMSEGGKVPGKAPVFGDDQKNDIVPAKLSPGEVVIPRSIMMGPDPVQNAAKFVQEQISKSSQGKQGYADGGEVASDDNWFASLEKGVGKMAAPFVQPFTDKSPEEYSKAVDEAVNSSYQPPQTVAQNTAAPMNQQSAPVIEQPVMPAQAEAPQLAQPAKTAQPNVDTSGANTKGLMMQQQGISQEAKAVGEQGKAEADVYARQQQANQEMAKKFQETKMAFDQEIKNATKDYAEQKIDPGHYWASRSVPQKFSTAIGLILGGLSAGLTGGPNPAIAHIDKAIDDDIKAQLAAGDKKQNLYKMNMQLLGNEMDAIKMTKAMQLDAFNNELQQTAAKSKDPIAKARALQMGGEIQGKIDALTTQAAVNKALSGGQQINPESLPEGQRERYIADPQFNGLTRTKEEGVKFRENLPVYKDTVNSLDRLLAITKEKGKSLSPEKIAEANQLRQLLVGTLREDVLGPGTIQAAERKFLLDDVLGNPTGLMNLDNSTKTKLVNLRDKIIAKKQEQAKAIGLNVKDADGGDQKGLSKMSPQDKNIYKLAQRNPNSPNAKKAMDVLNAKYGL